MKILGMEMAYGMAKISCLALLLSLSTTLAGTWFGNCPAVTTMSNVDFASYAGKWYLIQTLPQFRRKGLFQ